MALSNSSSLLVVYALVVVYALCYQLQSPLQPFLVSKLVGEDKGSEVAVTYGRLQSFFSMVQTVGSLTFGYILDRFGVRMGFFINFLACALTYYMLSITDSIEMLFLSKLPGVAMAGFLCAQCAVSRLTPIGQERVTALGRLTLAYTIGGSIGPYLGGLMGAEGNYKLSADIATAGSLVAAVVVFLVLPAKMDTTNDKISVDKKSAGNEGKRNWAQRCVHVLSIVGLLMFVKIATGVANSMSSTVKPLIMKDELGMTETDLGLFMSASFAFGGFANGVLLGPFTRLLGGRLDRVITNCLLCTAAAYALQTAIYHPGSGVFGVLLPESTRSYYFIGLTFFLSIFQYSLSTAITAETTSLVPADSKGTLLGMEHSFFALARIFGPSAGIYAYNNAGISGLSAAVAASFLLIMTVYALGKSDPALAVAAAGQGGLGQADKKEK